MGILSKLFGTQPKVMPTHLDAKNFDDEVLRSDLPVVVDFWGPGCPPCKQLEGVIISLATEYNGRVKFGEVNTHEAMKIARRYGVMATPTVIYFKDGKIIDRVAGFRGSLYHKEVIEEDLLASSIIAPGGRK